MKVEMTLEGNNWKHAYRYKSSEEEAAPIRHLYIMKFGLGKKPPKKIIVTIEGR